MRAVSQLNNALITLVGADIDRSASATAGTQVSTGILANGEIVVTDIGGIILDTTTVTQVDQVILVQKATIEGVARLIQTEPISPNQLIAYQGKEYLPTVQQVTYMGYNPVAGSGAIQVLNSYNYVWNTDIVELMGQLTIQYPALFVAYESDATATQAEIANALYALIVQKVNTYKNRPAKPEMVASAASIAITGTVANFSFTYGSPVVGIDGTVTNISAGDYLRLAAPVTGGTAPVYLVTAVNSPTSITLATPYVGTTQSIAVAAMSVGVAATINAGNFGIRLTGLQQPWVLDSRAYGVNVFNVGSPSPLTPVATTTKAFIGSGEYELITEEQVLYFRSKGQIYNYTEFPPIQPFYTTVSGQDYATLNLVWRTYNNDVTVQPFTGSVLVACALDGNVPNTFKTNFIGDPTSFVSVLDQFATLNPALQPQAGNL